MIFWQRLLRNLWCDFVIEKRGRIYIWSNTWKILNWQWGIWLADFSCLSRGIRLDTCSVLSKNGQWLMREPQTAEVSVLLVCWHGFASCLSIARSLKKMWAKCGIMNTVWNNIQLKEGQLRALWRNKSINYRSGWIITEKTNLQLNHIQFISLLDNKHLISPYRFNILLGTEVRRIWKIISFSWPTPN